MPRSALFLLLTACTATDPPGIRDTPPDETAGPDTDSAPPDSAPPDSGETGDTDTDTDPPEPPLIVLVLADDLGDNYLWAMPTVTERLAPECVRFTRAYSTVPLCCPVRASFLAGGEYPAEVGVHSNDLPNGGITFFHDTDTLATRLQGAGFRTAILGKYLNGYEDGVAPYVPPGWDRFVVPTDLGDSYDVTLVRGTSTPTAAGEGTYGDTGGEHLTGWLFDEALAFLDEAPDEPTFLLLTPQSPHIYGAPTHEDLGTWADSSPRPPSFGEEDVSDKPSWVQSTAPFDDAMITSFDLETRLMLDNLVSLDRAVGALLDGLEARGLADRATVIFTSDNGHLHGEHRLGAKGLAYEESIRVPILVRAPGLTPREDTRLVAMNLDLPATVAAIAGLPPTGGGLDLGPALLDPTTPDGRDHVFLETSVGAHPVWAGVVTQRWKYVEWGNGETELYDLYADPAELDSLHAAPPEEAELGTLAGWVDEHRALAIVTRGLDPGTVGVPYESVLETWGGTPPLTWSLDAGVLPEGLVLEPDGTLHGTPTTAGPYATQIRVTDGVSSPLTGVPATFVQSLSLTIQAGAALTGPAPVVTHVSNVSDVSDGSATFRVLARPGARVRIDASLDDTRDTPKVRSAEFVAGADGSATVSFPGLDRARAWHLQAVIDGVALPAGVLAPLR